MKRVTLKKDTEVSERMRYKIREISQDLSGYYRRILKFGIKDSRGYLAYSKAIGVINLMPYNRGRSELVELFNSARDSGYNTIDKMTAGMIAELPEFKKKRRGPFVRAGENNEYRRKS